MPLLLPANVPMHGTVAGNNSGIITYIPDQSFADDLDTLIYKVCSQANPAFCDSAKMVIYVMRAIGTFDLPSSNFYIYPNPTAEFVTLLNPGNSVECILSIFNLNGQQLWTEKSLLESGPNKISLIKNISPGMYIMEIKTNISAERFKIIIK